MLQVSQTVEEYLEAVYKLSERFGSARTSDIASELKVSLGTVTNTVKYLERLGLVVHEPYRGVKLTEKGLKIAFNVIRRHRIIERFLTDVLRMDWVAAHEHACKLEHGLTEAVAKPLESLLNKPKTCPHGNPIPSEDGSIREMRDVKLFSLNEGDSGIVTRIVDEKPDLLRLLSSLGITPGSLVKLKRKTSRGDRLTVEVARSDYEVAKDVAAKVYVEKTGF
ncbi:MAG: metal-dependent transcriptional regulator [Candidatus Nezhaarchaeales archaeon]